MTFWKCVDIYLCFINTWMTLLCGLLGTKNGRTIPTTPQRTEKRRTGRKAAPMVPGLDSENSPSLKDCGILT